MIRVAFFDAKEYDIASFEEYTRDKDIEFKFLEVRLSKDTVQLAEGCHVVCVFVNDIVDAEVIDRLHQLDIKMIALRCAGFNNVDVKHSFGKIHVTRVPAYSPYAVAEHAMAMLLTSVRRIHKAYNRTRDYNFSLNGFTGFDLHGKTIGIIGTGKIGRIFIDICKGFGMKIIAAGVRAFTQSPEIILAHSLESCGTGMAVARMAEAFGTVTADETGTILRVIITRVVNHVLYAGLQFSHAFTRLIDREGPLGHRGENACQEQGCACQ